MYTFMFYARETNLLFLNNHFLVFTHTATLFKIKRIELEFLLSYIFDILPFTIINNWILKQKITW